MTDKDSNRALAFIIIILIFFSIIFIYQMFIYSFKITNNIIEAQKEFTDFIYNDTNYEYIGNITKINSISTSYSYGATCIIELDNNKSIIINAAICLNLETNKELYKIEYHNENYDYVKYKIY